MFYNIYHGSGGRPCFFVVIEILNFLKQKPVYCYHIHIHYNTEWKPPQTVTITYPKHKCSPRLSCFHVSLLLCQAMPIFAASLSRLHDIYIDSPSRRSSCSVFKMPTGTAGRSCQGKACVHAVALQRGHSAKQGSNGKQRQVLRRFQGGKKSRD